MPNENPRTKITTPDNVHSESVTAEAASTVCPDNNVLPADLIVYLPLRKYTFTLKHQLLSGLGKVSQFVLKALSTEGFGLGDIERITGLTEEHLSPILSRLAGLGWYEPASRELTTQGHEMAKAAGLTGRRFSLWIDGLDNRNSPFILLSAEQIVQPEDDSSGIRLPEFERDWNILEVLQQQRLSRRLSDYKDNKGDLMPLLLLLCDEAEHDALVSRSLPGISIWNLIASYPSLAISNLYLSRVLIPVMTSVNSRCSMRLFCVTARLIVCRQY